MTQEKGDAYCWIKKRECAGCYYCRNWASEAQYNREYWGGMDCPACGKTLNEAGTAHEDGSDCG